jgi:hypothetical protein
MSAPPEFTCHKCGKPAKSRCSRCGVARYCSAECQREHWPVHTAGCKIDAAAGTAPVREADVFRINEQCTHGGPSPAREMALISKVTELVIRVSQTADQARACGADPAAAELRVLEEAVRATPAVAVMRNPGTPKMCVAMAVDAFGNTDAGPARQFMRMAFFIEAFQHAEGGDAFLAALHGDAFLAPRGSPQTQPTGTWWRGCATHTAGRGSLRSCRSASRAAA